MGATTTPRRHERIFPLWFGILGPAVLWAMRIGASYVLVPYACSSDRIWILHLVTLGGLLGAAFAGWVAWRIWRAWRGAGAGEPGSRIRFMALLGILSSAFFFLVMVAEGLANFLVHPCQTGGAPLA